MEAGKFTNRAQQAGAESLAAVRAKNKTAWLELFADDAVIQDPVGVSPLDPSGLGHRGKEAIARFWDMAIAPGQLETKIRESYPAGDECANVATFVNRMPNGAAIATELVVVYRVDARGRIVSLKAYWEYAKIAAQLEQMLGTRQAG
ncbi:MAG: nuclear transport factor 2 family protein [Gammaproteobacteria bacterium]|nr:nuclear transport factor 2 family protein [Gammaproteobacteria bacterium]